MPEFCEVERDGHVLVVTIARPEVMNAIHPPASEELARAFDEFAADPELWVAIVTGQGDRAFSAGNDLKYQAAGGKLHWPASGFGGLTARFDLPKPLIAAVNGLAMGGGFEIVLACDIVVAAETAVFALPEPRVGLAALGGGLQRLPRQIPLKHAMGMLLTGRRVGAEEGQRLGFVNEVVPAGQALAAARRWAGAILECSPVSVRTTKAVALRSLGHASLEESLTARYDEIAELVRSEDFLEGPRAFAAKRKPAWKGR
ncbi:MAG: enoyl-CoA hydratase-related protein [Deltaproteobacteria bacterium]|nr:enoyl-CoA hydratase-related protein [Deltaproteobacteria bacterium]